MKNSVRRSQAVVPFGVGAIIDFRREALMSAGLDVWPKDPECRLDDARLARKLGVTYFRQPPPAQSEEGTPGALLPFVRFPLWHLCPRCRALKKAKWNDTGVPRCDSSFKFKEDWQPCSSFVERRRRRMVPLRFVAVCKEGHIEDFPWIEWAHCDKGQSLRRGESCPTPQLRLTTTGLAGLVGLVVRCESEGCKKGRSMLGAAGPGGLKGLTCSGSKPWLGPDEKDTCAQTDPPIVLQRGASNIYFANVSSSILIPPYTSPVRKMIDVPKYWAYLTDGVGAGGAIDQVRLEELSKMQRLDVGQVRAAVEEKLREQSTDAKEQTEEDFRYAEYSALLGDKRPIDDDLRIAPQKIESYDEWFRRFFESVVLVEKLAETRALTDFSRVDPSIPGGRVPRRKLSLNPTIPWLPAIRVYGEGIFVVLRRAALQSWANSTGARVAALSRRYDQVTAARGRPPRGLPPSFFVLHMLAHMLIRRLSFECGYGSSSLRERIYCRESATGAMAGILIYTAAGDCEGTMGGLVRQGKPARFESVLRSALADAWWCSSDPLCGESSGQGTDSLNLAACHACALLPETSCEEGNRLLDRVCVVGLPNAPQLGFFGEFDPSANA